MPAYLPITKRRIFIECVLPVVLTAAFLVYVGVSRAQRIDIPERAEGQACPSWSDTFYYPAEVTHIVDGDTLDLEIHLGLGVIKQERIRLPDIDAWETRGEERERGLAAKAFVESWVHNSFEVRVKTRGKRGKYGRLIADIVECGELLSEHLVAQGHATYAQY